MKNFRKQLEEILNNYSMIDDLPGDANKRLFDQILTLIKKELPKKIYFKDSRVVGDYSWDKPRTRGFEEGHNQVIDEMENKLK